MFLAKYDAAGTHVWSQRFGGTSRDKGVGVATDAGGNVVVTGLFNGTVDFGGGPLTSAGGVDVFLAKYNAAGTHVWSQRFGGTSQDEGVGVATDASRNVVTGLFRGTVDFGGGLDVPTLTSAGLVDVFLAKYDAAGTHVWSQRFGGTSHDEIFGVATDATGNFFVTGPFNGTVDFGGGPLTSAGLDDVFLAKYRR